MDLSKLLLIIVLHLSYYIQCYLEEVLYNKQYVLTLNSNNFGGKLSWIRSPQYTTFYFKEPKINYFLSCLMSVIVSHLVISISKHKNEILTLSQKIKLGSFFTTSRLAAEYSMKNLSFIPKVVTISAKSLTIFIGTVISKTPMFKKKEESYNFSQKNKLYFILELIKEFLCTAMLIYFAYNIKGVNEQIVNGFLLLTVSIILSHYLAYTKKKIKYNKVSKDSNQNKDNDWIIPWYYTFIFNLFALIIIFPVYSKILL